MTPKKLQVVWEETTRFLEKVEVLRERCDVDDVQPDDPIPPKFKAVAAVKRASLDLSRALVDFRTRTE